MPHEVLMKPVYTVFLLTTCMCLIVAICLNSSGMSYVKTSAD